MTDVFDFPTTFGDIELVEQDQHDEGPVPRRSRNLPLAAGTEPSTFRLHRVSDNAQMVELTGYADVANFAYDPPSGHVPQGPMQWYLRRPGETGFTAFGDVFQYRREKHPQYWERNGL